MSTFDKKVKIGDVSAEVLSTERPELVPFVQAPFYEDSQVLIFDIQISFNNH